MRLLAVVMACLFHLIVETATAQPTAGGGVEQVLFQQPAVNTMSGRFCVKCLSKTDWFNIVQWEPNPLTADGGDLAASWDMSVFTGFRPQGRLQDHQVAFRADTSSSGAQMGAATVGAYLDSNDLKPDFASKKFIITPRVEFARDAFSFGNGREPSLAFSLDLQVPVAIDGNTNGSSTYVVSDLRFFDRTTGHYLYLNAELFRNHDERGVEWVFFDPDTQTPVVFSACKPNSQYLSIVAGSSTFQATPWSGWRHFSYIVTAQNFRHALAAASARYPQATFSRNLSDWSLAEWHLNAELLYASGPAKLGWSMKGARLAARTFQP